MIKVIHIISGLDSGGAENMLLKLVKYSDKEKVRHEVISLKDKGTVGPSIEKEGIKVHTINMSSKNVLKSFAKMRKLITDFDIVNTWLYHGDLVGYILTKIFKKKKIIWNIRHSNLDKNANKKSTLSIVKINALLSKKVDLITYNSEKAKESHESVGYSKKNPKLVPNGFELDKFYFDKVDRKKIREELKIKDEEIVFITVGRWHAQKDYVTLINALSLVKSKYKNFKMIFIGKDLDSNNEELLNKIELLGLKNNTILLGRRDNIKSYLSSANCYISSSVGESFSNSIGEAMACELNTIVTDVGDSKIIVGNTGVVIPPKNSEILAEKMIQQIQNSSRDRNIEARKRVRNKYDIKNVVNIYNNVYQQLTNN